MIIVFPMLVSRAVSENSIPGIAKTLENYIIVHKQDMIMSSVNNSPQRSTLGILAWAAGGFKLNASKVKEDVDLSEALPSGAQPTGHKKGAPNQGQTTSTSGDDDDQEKKQWEREKRASAQASVKLNVSDMKSVSLEPTYINIERSDKYGNKTTELLGVKVVPYRVKSDVKLSHLILQDSKLNTMNASLVALGRKLTRWFYRVFDKWTKRLRIMGGLSPSGDPRRDIIMGRTGMGKDSEGFIILSKQEDVDDYFIDNISRINRLYKMGWGNFIIADDIGRTAYFCMKKFRGLCNAIPYAMMYDRIGQGKAYESMEDAKKANSSIFKVSARFSRVIGEWKVERKLLKYSQLNEGINDE